MDITKEIRIQKKELLSFFRSEVNKKYGELEKQNPGLDYKKKADAINKIVIALKDSIVNQLSFTANLEQWETTILLECVLMVNYVCYVVMLETRNRVWKYDYMAFSRRIGELWEPFCKLCFFYPIKEISLYEPPVFNTVKNEQIKEFKGIIETLSLSPDEKTNILDKYNRLWSIITSGEIDLTSDLHFTDGTTKYVVDFKSGFGSNEKGNTNRLLMVGEVYKILQSNYKCLIFVRSNDNNHYLQTLKNSGIWDTFTGSDTYKQIQNYSGYDIEKWINNNIDWYNDFCPEMANHIKDNKLETYLIW